MKKSYTFLSLLFSFLFLEKINAQWSVTPSIGVNYCTITHKKTQFKDYEARKYQNIVLSTFGLTLKKSYPKEHFAIELSNNFSQKGYKLNSINLHKVRYIDVVPAVTIFLPLHLNLYVGANVGRRIDELFSTDDAKSWNRVFPGTSLFRKFDFGGIIGIQTAYKNVQFGIFANRSLLPTGQYRYENSSSATTYINQYHQGFQFRLGYIFALKDI